MLTRLALALAAFLLTALPGSAQNGETARTNAPAQEHCITVMNGFPDNGHIARYQFFRLTEALAEDANPAFRGALAEYGEGQVHPATPMIEIIEAIANPVLRQAAPSVTVAQMDYLVGFANDCRPYLEGQAESLEAFDPALADAAFNSVIAEDALFLRQVLSDVLFRLNAHQDPQFGPAVARYASRLEATRNDIEFAAFEANVGEIEALYMDDLDGRLAQSNDMINQEMDGDILADSVTLAEDMNRSSEEQANQMALRTIFVILNGF